MKSSLTAAWQDESLLSPYPVSSDYIEDHLRFGAHADAFNRMLEELDWSRNHAIGFRMAALCRLITKPPSHDKGARAELELNHVITGREKRETEHAIIQVR